MKWKYNRMTKTYESDKFLIKKRMSFWSEWFTIFRKSDNIIIKSGIKKLSHAKNICNMLS